MITFSSDEELVEALGSMSGDVFRVYVKVDENSSRDSSLGEGEKNFQFIVMIFIKLMLK